jgi:2-iminobutanoate/2-iminopropanoate deaminase
MEWVSYAQTMPRETIFTPKAPRPIGPYAQAVVSHGMVYCSGQIPLDPDTGEMVSVGDVRGQAERVLQNLEAVLTAAGASRLSVVKTTIYLADLQDFGAVNDVYARFFADRPPARTTIEAAGLPRGALVEIDAIAAVGD